jgi:hypothetical protein
MFSRLGRRPRPGEAVRQRSLPRVKTRTIDAINPNGISTTPVFLIVNRGEVGLKWPWTQDG